MSIRGHAPLMHYLMSSAMTLIIRVALSDFSGWPALLSTETVDVFIVLRTAIWNLDASKFLSELLNNFLKNPGWLLSEFSAT